VSVNQPIDTEAAWAYEKGLVPALNGAPAALMVDMAAVRDDERVIDVACGTGIVARLVAAKCPGSGRIAGIDIDPAMLEVARALGARSNGAAIDWHCGSALAMPFAPASFDVALCLQGLQYLPDCHAGLCEIHRVLSASGRFIAAVWTRLEACKGQLALARALERRDIDASPIRKAYSFGTPDRIMALMKNARFRNIGLSVSTAAGRFDSARAFVDAFAAGSLSSRAALAKIPVGERDAFLEEIDTALREFADGDGISLPLEYLVVSARA